MAETKTGSLSSDSKMYGAAAYLFGLITGVIVLLMKPEDKYVKFHAMQSIILNVVMIVVFMVLGFVMTFLSLMLMMVGGGMIAILFSFVYMIISLLVFVLWLFLMWKAYNGEKFKLPMIGEQAEKLANK
ncbi:MAG: DUF4870 domain-containing protein [Candidatus Diapherotrites archaeon]